MKKCCISCYKGECHNEVFYRNLRKISIRAFFNNFTKKHDALKPILSDSVVVWFLWWPNSSRTDRLRLEVSEISYLRWFSEARSLRNFLWTLLFWSRAASYGWKTGAVCFFIEWEIWFHSFGLVIQNRWVSSGEGVPNTVPVNYRARECDGVETL